MKLPSRLVLPGLLLVATSSVFASEGTTSSTTDGPSDLTTYVLNLGGYLGYNLETNPGGNNATISQTLLNLPEMQVLGNYLFNSFLGSLLVNTASQSVTQFVPTTLQTYATINAFANYTFTSPSYSTPSPDAVSASPLVDQPPFQTDPVSQSVLNILTTPDFSYCLNNAGTAVASCTYPSGTLNINQVLTNSIGTIPNTQSFFSYAQNQPLLLQLNSNSLITPLLYTTTSSASSSTSSGDNNTAKQGLVAQSQAQQAANFIRFVSGSISPLPLPNRNDYDNLYLRALNTGNTYSVIEQSQAQATLATYLNNIRTYAAQSSVVMGNLYYILSKRLPQSQSSTSSGQQTSQAMSEFKMATWRLYNPDQSPNAQWLAQINQSSAATVQKEIAGLLAEINYQLYLTRQQDERLLLTNSMLILQNARLNPPSITNASNNSSTTSTGAAASQ